MYHVPTGTWHKFMPGPQAQVERARKQGRSEVLIHTSGVLRQQKALVIFETMQQVSMSSGKKRKVRRVQGRLYPYLQRMVLTMVLFYNTPVNTTILTALVGEDIRTRTKQTPCEAGPAIPRLPPVFTRTCC